MALTIDCPNTDVISLEEYIEVCESVDLFDLDTLLGTAPKLKALGNNRHFLADVLTAEMTNVHAFQGDNNFKPATFLLHRGKGYTVRAVTWLPSDRLYHPEIFSYDELHDHNFNFLTCGYYGSGYRTRIWEYDYDEVLGYPGEEVKLRFLEETSLPVGKVMFYAASRDVHVQLPPTEMSISLNLIVLPRNKADRFKAQYYFDSTTHTVRATFVRMRQRRRIFDAVGQLGDDETLEVLEAIARTHEDPRTRVLAWETLFDARPDRREAYLRSASLDESEYVRAVALQL